jgi:hypothetical protein
MPESSHALERIERTILVIRGHNVMLDSDLAVLYGVPVKALTQAVKRNLQRFPDDFAFRLTEEEYKRLRSQTVTLKKGRGQHRKYLAYVFALRMAAATLVIALGIFAALDQLNIAPAIVNGLFYARTVDQSIGED